MFDELAALRFPSSYTSQDMAKDFIDVFNGESTVEQGRRVFSMINNHCSPRSKDNLSHDTRAFRDGMRSVPEFITRSMVVRQDVEIQTQP